MVEGQSPLPLWSRGERIGDFRAELIVGNAVIVGLEAARALEPIHDAQLLNNLRASELELGLLLKLGPAPRSKRLVFANEKKKNLHLSA